LHGFAKTPGFRIGHGQRVQRHRLLLAGPGGEQKGLSPVADL
jgi:hypothetical protein